MISGIRAATQPYVVLADGDGQFDPKEVASLAAFVPEYDVVVGKRIQRADPLMRRINGKAWTTLVRSSLASGFRISIAASSCSSASFSTGWNCAHTAR